jgi:hypothetical protein
MGYSIETDPLRRLLDVSYIRNMGPREASGCLEEIRALLPELQQGFRLLADFTRLESMEGACTPYLEKIMELCDSKGVLMVVRIIPDERKDIGFNIMSLFHYSRAVCIITCGDRITAANLLLD